MLWFSREGPATDSPTTEGPMCNLPSTTYPASRTDIMRQIALEDASTLNQRLRNAGFDISDENRPEGETVTPHPHDDDHPFVIESQRDVYGVMRIVDRIQSEIADARSAAKNRWGRGADTSGCIWRRLAHITTSRRPSACGTGRRFRFTSGRGCGGSCRGDMGEATWKSCHVEVGPLGLEDWRGQRGGWISVDRPTEIRIVRSVQRWSWLHHTPPGSTESDERDEDSRRDDGTPGNGTPGNGTPDDGR